MRVVVLVRSARPADFDAVAKLFRQVFPTTDYTRTHPAAREVELAFVEWKLDHEDSGDMHLFFALGAEGSERVLFIVEDASSVIGMGGVILGSANNAELVRVQVLEQHQGKGIGTAILVACEAWARERGAKRLLLDTWVINTSGQRFYESNGFAKAREVRIELADRFHKLGLDAVSGLTIDDLRSWEMVKDL